MPTFDEHSDPLNEQLAGLGAVIAVGDAVTSLTAVRDTVAIRRRRRNIIGGGLAAAVLVAGGIVVVGAVNDGVGSDTIAIDGAGDDAADDDGADVGPADPDADAQTNDDASVETAGTAPQAVSVETRQVAAINPAATRVSLGIGQSETSERVEMVDWIVPWQGGFLAASTTYLPQALPAELPDDILALFPSEVVEFFDGELPPTIDEATQMLSEAGLLDEVAEVLQSSPEASAAIYGAGSPPDPVTEVVFSADGVDWEPIEFVRPDGAMGLYGMQSTGSRLAVAVQQEPEYLPSSAENDAPLVTARLDMTAPILVATTVDLVNWDVVEVEGPGRPVDLPELFSYGLSPSELAINDTGWLLGVDSYSDLDVESLLPDEVRDAFVNGGGGYGTSWDDNGVQVEVYGEQGPVETTVPSDDDNDNATDNDEFVEPEPFASFEFTWDELGVDAAVVESINGGSGQRQMFTAPWGGVPVQVQGVEAWAAAAGSDGFYASLGNSIDYSVDGITWSEIPLPDGSSYVSTIKTLPEGIVVLAGDDAGNSSLLRLANSTAKWERLEIPGAPLSMNDVFGGTGGTPAMIVDGTEREVPEPTEITVIADGFTMVMREGIAGSSILVTDSDGTVVADETFDWRDGGEPASWSYTNNGIEIVSATGDPIVTFGNDVMETAYREQTDRYEQTDDYDPDLWLLATIDGERWLAEDIDASIDDGQFGPSVVAISGNILLISSDGGWDRYDLS